MAKQNDDPYRAYHEGDFQTIDPVTGLKRKLPQPPAAAEESAIEATDAARSLAADEGMSLAGLTGTGADGRITVEDVRAAIADRG